jgi:hypothetical protein
MSQIEHIKSEIKRLFGENQFLTARQLVMLGIAKSEDTLSRWRHLGNGPQCYKFSNGKYVYDASGLIEWLEGCVIAPKTKSSQPTQSSLINSEKKLMPSSLQSPSSPTTAHPNLIATSGGTLLCLD